MLSSEGIAQRKLDQARISRRGRDLRELGIVDVLLGDGRAGEVRVIPNIEEVSGKSKLLTLTDQEVLDQRKVPVLLERSPVEISTQVPEARCTGVFRIECTTGGISVGSGCEIVDIEVAVEAAMNIARGLA